MSDRTFTAKEISEIINKSQRMVEIRARKEAWAYIEEAGNGRGGKTKKYPITSLPADVQQAIINKEGVKPELLPALKPAAAAAMISKHTGADEFLATCDMTKALDVISTGGKGYDRDTAVNEQDLVDPRIAKIMAIIRESEAMPRNWNGGKRKWIESVAMRHAVQWQSIYRWIKKYEKKGIA
ncbi:MAG: DNA-binding protein, partial [Smithella sp.]